MTETQSTDWGYLLSVDEFGSTSDIKYRRAHELIEDLAKVGPNSGLTLSGYYPETRQRGVRVALIKSSDALTQAVCQGLMQLLPHLAPVQDKTNNKPYLRISVFEHTLSEYGTYAMVLRPEESQYSLVCTRYGREALVTEKSSLMELLSYVQKHHYYSDEA